MSSFLKGKRGANMRLRISIQLSVSLLFLFLSTLAALYEGSAIRENPFEWRWSTPFTLLTTDNLSHADQLSKFDYLIYAAKFQPLFPSIMLVSLIHLLILSTYLITQTTMKRAYYLSSLVCLMLSGCLMMLSNHVETKYFYVGILLVGTLITLLLAIQNFNQTNSRSCNKT